MSFTLDTSGLISARDIKLPGAQRVWLRWEDLTPFTQGALQQALEEAHPALQAEREHRFAKFMRSEIAQCPEGERFSDLAPETVARIMEDCERVCSGPADMRGHEESGRLFHRDRQQGFFIKTGFPPLTLYLADDGLIRIRS